MTCPNHIQRSVSKRVVRCISMSLRPQRHKETFPCPTSARRAHSRPASPASQFAFPGTSSAAHSPKRCDARNARRRSRSPPHSDSAFALQRWSLSQNAQPYCRCNRQFTHFMYVQAYYTYDRGRTPRRKYSFCPVVPLSRTTHTNLHLWLLGRDFCIHVHLGACC